MQIDSEDLREFIHSSINKAAAAQGILSLVLKKDLGEKERELIEKALKSVNETIAEIKTFKKTHIKN